MGRHLVFCAAFYLLTCPWTATAQSIPYGEPQAFGDAGQWFVYAGSSLDASNKWVRQNSLAAENYFHFDIQPSVGVFLAKNFFVQLGAGIARSSISADNILLPTSSETRFSVAPGLGYNFPLSRIASLYPHVQVAYSQFWRSNYQSTQRNTAEDVEITLDIPAAIHMTKHLSLSLGVYAAQSLLGRLDDLDSKIKETLVGVRGGFIGWF